MLIQLTISTILIVLTVLFHALCLDYTAKNMRGIERFFAAISKRFWKAYSITFAVLMIFCAHIGQIWLWAIFYFGIEEFQDFESALYFSTSAFTTLGMGDVVLSSDWRLIGSIEAANGFILFGWSTAFIFEIMSQIYRREAEQMRSYKKKGE